MTDSKKCEQFFKEYTDVYVPQSANHLLKRDHTLRVEALCERIALSLGLSDAEVDLAKRCGLAHDIGRFEQYQQYHSFFDKNTVDHGTFGADILKEHGLLAYFANEEERQVVLNSVIWHNKLKVPKTLTKKEELFTNIVRDADKLDILYMVTTGEMQIDTEGTHISDTILNQLLNGHPILISDAKTRADRVCVWLGFVYDLMFAESIDYLSEQGYMDLIIEKYSQASDNQIYKQQLEVVSKRLNEVMKERGTKCYKQSTNLRR